MSLLLGLTCVNFSTELQQNDYQLVDFRIQYVYATTIGREDVNALTTALKIIEDNLGSASVTIQNQIKDVINEIRAVLKKERDGVTILLEKKEILLRTVSANSPEEIGRKTCYAVTATLNAADALTAAVNKQREVAKHKAKNALKLAKSADGGKS